MEQGHNDPKISYGMMVRRCFIYAMLLIAIASCGKQPYDRDFGAIDFSLSSEVEAEVVTRSAANGDLDAYNITLEGRLTGDDTYVQTLVYGEIEGPVRVPYGLYTVSAESCSPEDAHSFNSGYGCVRFFGMTEDVQVMTPAAAPTPVQVSCTMANAKVSVLFDEGFLSDFTSVSASLKMGERSVSVTSENSSLVQSYFNVGPAGSAVEYTVYGNVDDNTLKYTGTIYLLPAKHAKLVFKSNHNGVLGPQVTVDGEMGTNEIPGEIDPSSGTPVTGGEVECPVIYVDYQINDAVEVETVIDVIDKEDMTL